MSNIRPTKKQRELLSFIEQFINEHGYSPSYREVMNGLSYNSVATVALHINNLIARGHLRKRDHSARSLEVVTRVDAGGSATAGPSDDGHENWLFDRMTDHLEGRVRSAKTVEEVIADGQILAEALVLLGYGDQARSLQRQVEAYAAGD